MRILFLLLFAFGAFGASGQHLEVYGTSCENFTNPLGIDSRVPRLSWKLRSSATDVRQTAYEIRVGQDLRTLKSGKGLAWHTGKVATDRSILVAYDGEPLLSGQRYYWQVRVWDNQGRRSGWSEISHWETGLLDTSDWKAAWVSSGLSVAHEGPTIQFRKEFKAAGGVKKARLYVTAHGVYEAHINGQRVGHDYFTPGWTSYHNRLQYQVYDVAGLLSPTGNALAISVGDGWFKGNLVHQRNFYGKEEALLAQLVIQYTDGRTEIVATDSSWSASAEGPIRKSDLYNGEWYDATLENPEWKLPNFNGLGWKPAFVLSDIPVRHLVTSLAPTVRKTAVLKPVSVTINDKGEKIIDFGQNLVGWVKFNVDGQRGDTVRLSHAEVLDKNGYFYTENLRSAKQEIVYVLKGGGPEAYEPHFTFQGFRYVRVDGNRTLLDADNVEAVVLHTDMAMTGSFETSDSLLNRLQQNIQWGQRGNFLDIPTDCPQRDERFGWTGDAQAFFNTSAYNMDVSGFFSKWLMDLKADQVYNGNIPFRIPHFPGDHHGGAAGWGDAATIIPWNFYRAYGDTALLVRQYQSMEAWIRYVQANSQDDLWKHSWHFGDWLFYTPEDDKEGLAAITDKQLIAQAFYINSLKIMTDAARLLKKEDDMVAYGAARERAIQAFLSEFVTPNGRLVSGTQTAYVLALQFDVLPTALREQAAARLVDNIKSYGNHLTTGFLGTPYLCHVLSRFGYWDVAYALLMRKEYPSWLYPVTKGATTIWERWDGIKADGSFQTPEMNSFNHYAYGAIGEWMYRHVAGIQQSDDGPAYKDIVIAPRPGGGLGWAKGTLETPYGMVSSAWKITGDRMEVDLIIPPNTSATFHFPPNSDLGTLELQNRRLQVSDNLCILGSGTYNFAFRWTQ